MCKIIYWLVAFFDLESTNLEKVTVKSLDEIKREKEQRLQRESASAHARSHDSVQAGGSAEDTGKDLHISGKISIANRHCISDFELKETIVSHLS